MVSTCPGRTGHVLWQLVVILQLFIWLVAQGEDPSSGDPGALFSLSSLKDQKQPAKGGPGGLLERGGDRLISTEAFSALPDGTRRSWT